MSSKPNLKINETYVKKLLNEMIKIDSILGKESNLAYFLGEEAEKLGMTICYDKVAESRENIYAKIDFDKKGKTLTFNGHSDTVEVSEGWQTDPFTPVEKEGKLLGLGSVDMKAGLACQLGAIKTLVDSGEDLRGTIHYAAVVDEEGYGTGAIKMLSHPDFGKGKTDGVIISEPCYGDSEENPLPLGLTGKVLYNVTVKGLSAHAFRPEKGVNAITETSRILAAIDDIMENPEKELFGFKLPKDPEFGYGSFCVLKIDGGYKTYSVVVPEQCDFVLNQLTLPGETKESVLRNFTKFVENMKLKSKIEIKLVDPFYLSYKISKDHSLFQALKQTYEQVFKKIPYTAYLKMITDANTFMGAGKIPTVHFGPKGGNLHAPDEYVMLNSLKPSIEMFVHTFINFQERREKEN